MKDKKGFVVMVVGLIILFVGASALYAQLTKDRTPPEQLSTQPTETAGKNEPLQQAPDFTVYDLQGNPVQLSSYFGKPIVLNFWASWCGPCQSEMPDFQKTYLEQGDDIQFLMVNMTDGSRETVQTASDFISQQGYTFPALYDTDTDAAMTYGVYSLPTTLFIDAQGYLVAQATGAIDGETLQRGIDMIKG